jgi:hypothetical protein
MKIKKYTILNKNLIFKGIKYEVGKRYKKNSLLVYEDIKTLLFRYFFIRDVIEQIQIRVVYEYDDYYVIHNEINYYEDFDSNVKIDYKNLFLLLRYRDKNIINKNITSMSIYEKMALAIVGNRIHIKKLIKWVRKNRSSFFEDVRFEHLQYNIIKNINVIDYLKFHLHHNSLIYLGLNNLRFKEIDKILKNHKFKYDKEIADLGYDRYLDYFIDNKIHLQNDFVARSILTKGRHKDLDFFMNNSETIFIAVPIIHWQREKDLIKLSKSTNKDISQLANKELNEIKLKKRLN